jgi:hypothetical protein
MHQDTHLPRDFASTLVRKFWAWLWDWPVSSARGDLPNKSLRLLAQADQELNNIRREVRFHFLGAQSDKRSNKK